MKTMKTPLTPFLFQPPRCRSTRKRRQLASVTGPNNDISSAAGNEMDLIANPIKVLDLEDSVQSSRRRAEQIDAKTGAFTIKYNFA